MNVVALTSGADVPSRRFRVAQHIPTLEELGIHVREHLPGIARYRPPPREGRLVTAAWTAAKVLTRFPGVLSGWRSDLVWLERELFAGRRTLEPFVGRRYVFDVDDAIWLTDRRRDQGTAAIAGRASAVIAGNAFIADHFRAIARWVEVVPTAVDTTRYMPGNGRRDGRFRVGWIGTSSNLRYLEALEGALGRFVESQDAELFVVADRPPAFRRLALSSRFRFSLWSAEEEVDAIRSMDVGLMPLADEPWARGKCGLKMLQYMACGIPVVASPVGVNPAIARDGGVILADESDAWLHALIELKNDAAARRDLGTLGRRNVERSYSVLRVAPMLAEVFRSVG